MYAREISSHKLTRAISIIRISINCIQFYYPFFVFVNRYGVGYHMTLVKEPNSDSSLVEKVVKDFIPLAEKVTDVGMELSYILPTNSASKFADLFEQLESEPLVIQ